MVGLPRPILYVLPFAKYRVHPWLLDTESFHGGDLQASFRLIDKNFQTAMVARPPLVWLVQCPNLDTISQATRGEHEIKLARTGLRHLLPRVVGRNVEACTG